MTVLNGADTIAACLESISCQTFMDYELIIIDGGSIDGTMTIVKGASIKHLIAKEIPGIGLYAGLNAGIDVASGEWYYFIGCDDKLFNCNVLHQISLHLTDSSECNRMIAGRVYYPKRGIITNPQTWGFIALAYRLHHQGLFYNRSLFNVLRYDTLLSFSADYEINLKHIAGGTKIGFVDTVIAEFGEDGESSQNLRKAYLERQRVHTKTFSGMTRIKVKSVARIQYNIWLVRKRVRSILSG